MLYGLVATLRNSGHNRYFLTDARSEDIRMAKSRDCTMTQDTANQGRAKVTGVARGVYA